MSDSSDPDELFASSGDENEQINLDDLDKPPKYYNTREFKNFTTLHDLTVSEHYGYMYMHL